LQGVTTPTTAAAGTLLPLLPHGKKRVAAAGRTIQVLNGAQHTNQGTGGSQAK
jgi:hypothetical protein